MFNQSILRCIYVKWFFFFDFIKLVDFCTAIFLTNSKRDIFVLNRAIVQTADVFTTYIFLFLGTHFICSHIYTYISYTYVTIYFRDDLRSVLGFTNDVWFFFYQKTVFYLLNITKCFCALSTITFIYNYYDSKFMTRVCPYRISFIN